MQAIKTRTYLCQICDEPYGDCCHTDKYQTLPKDERGIVISNMQLLVLVDVGDI